MPTPHSPFTDTARIEHDLYSTPDRLSQRTSALHHAKIAGADATVTITSLAAAAAPAPARIADIGCGRGTTTLHLARHYRTAAITAVDQSPALLAATAERLYANGHHADLLTADSHHLRGLLPPVDLAVAGFCLYHSPRPGHAITEIGSCLTTGAILVIATKSADSYHEIDEAVAASGLDPQATTRPGLYDTFHTGNAETITRAVGLTIRQRVDHEHVFRFTGAAHLAAYLATSPKYQLPDSLSDRAGDRLAGPLADHLPEEPLTATSTVSYLVAARL